MFESPMLRRMQAEAIHKTLLAFLTARFGTVPQEVVESLSEILDEKKLTKLTVRAAKCPNLEAFHEALLS